MNSDGVYAVISVILLIIIGGMVVSYVNSVSYTNWCKSKGYTKATTPFIWQGRESAYCIREEYTPLNEVK